MEDYGQIKDDPNPDPTQQPSLPERLKELKAGNEREEHYREMTIRFGNIMGLFITFFAMNKMPLPGVIGPDVDREADAALKALEKLEKGAVILGPTFNA